MRVLTRFQKLLYCSGTNNKSNINIKKTNERRKRDDRVCDVMCQALTISFFIPFNLTLSLRIYFFEKNYFPTENIDRI